MVMAPMSLKAGSKLDRTSDMSNVDWECDGKVKWEGDSKRGFGLLGTLEGRVTV